MASREFVAEVFRERLREDSGKQLKKAGNLWRELPLNFYYLPGPVAGTDEDGVDLAVAAVTERVAASDGTVIPDDEVNHLISVVDLKTKADDAITLIYLATFQPLVG